MSKTLTCPTCGSVLQVRAYMVWSNRMQRFVRKEMTKAEYDKYIRTGSCD